VFFVVAYVAIDAACDRLRRVGLIR